MSCPLYTKMRPESTSLYVFPSANEDFTSGEALGSNKVRFSKFALLKLPKWSVIKGVLERSTDIKFDIPIAKTLPTNLRDGLPDLLRSYCANHEVTLRSTIDSDGKYIYDPNAINTVSEKAFWKLLQRLEQLQVEIADKNVDSVDWDQTPSLANPNFPFGALPPDHYNQQLWRERDALITNITTVRLVNSDSVTSVGDTFTPLSQPAPIVFNTNYFYFDIQFFTQTRYKKGDQILVRGIDQMVFNTPVNETGVFWVQDAFYKDPKDLGDPSILPNYQKIWLRVALLKTALTPASLVIFNAISTSLLTPTYIASADLDIDANYNQIQAVLKYERVVKYVGNIDISTNIQEANRSLNVITASVAETEGQSPLILFKTRCDVNYKPDQNWPNESQVQDEILGAELTNSLINRDPNLFPGDKYGIFDNLPNQTFFAGKYLSSTGDKLKRSGDYYGNLIPLGRQLDPEFYLDYSYYPAEKLDGLGINFNLTEYKAGAADPFSKDWEDFNSNKVGPYQPRSFEFNVVLWYYDVTQTTNGIETITTNLYGIQILEDPYDSDSLPIQKKICGYNEIEGNGFLFELSRSIQNSIDQLPVPLNDLAIEEGFNHNVYENLMQKMYQTQEAFEYLIKEVAKSNQDYLKGQLSWLTASNQVARIQNTQEALLKEFSRLQALNLNSSNTVKVVPLNSYLIPENVTPNWSFIQEFKTSQFSSSKRLQVILPEGLHSLIEILNETTLYETLTIDLGDMEIGQSVDIIIKANTTTCFPSLLKITSNNTLIGETWMAPYNVGNPGFYNSYIKSQSITQPVLINATSGITTIPSFNANQIWAKTGDWVYLSNAFYKKGNSVTHWKGWGQITQLNTLIVKVITGVPQGTTTLLPNANLPMYIESGIQKQKVTIYKKLDDINGSRWEIEYKVI